MAAEWQPARHRALWEDLPPVEAAVVRFHDPRDDLIRRATEWGHVPAPNQLGELALFAAGLARAESDAWAGDRPQTATRAVEARRFLVGDRLMHWVVPWLDAAGRCYPDERETAHRARDVLLDLGERLRVAPSLAGAEGLTLPGEDSYGPRRYPAAAGEWPLSLWSGLVILRATLGSMRNEPLERRRLENGWLADPGFRRDLRTLYEVAAARWSSLAGRYPGTARLWSDLSARARRTAAALS